MRRGERGERDVRSGGRDVKEMPEKWERWIGRSGDASTGCHSSSWKTRSGSIRSMIMINNIMEDKVIDKIND